MTECARSPEALLDAELEELSGVAETDLGVHVRACARCAATARAILEGNDALDGVLGSVPPIDARALLARARVEVVPGAEKRAPRFGRRWRQGAALAAAAAIAVLLVLSERDRSMPGVEMAPRAEVYSMVEAPADLSVAVIQTDDPDITILWFY